MTKRTSSAALEADLSTKGYSLLDCRPSAAYNGWALEGESRGGHIPGAISFPLHWFDEVGDKEALHLLTEKGVDPASPIIVTGYGKDMPVAAERLRQLGFHTVQIHKEGVREWLEDDQREVMRLPRYRRLVHADWLAKLVNGRPPESGLEKTVLAHVNFDNWGDYDEGHIPGAIWLDTLALEDAYTWNSRTPEELSEELSAHGITRDTTVVLYGRTSDPNMLQDHPGKQAGQLASMRAALLLMYAGVQDVRVLDGGLGAWQRAGGAITRDETAPTPVKETGLKIPERPEFIITTEKAKEFIAEPQSELVSVRSWAEYIGEVSGYHYIEHKGRIPGALFGNCGSDAYHMETYRNPDDTMRSFHEIKSVLGEVGITPDKRVAFYCGTGWRASEAWFYTWLMGWPDVAIYDGGWYEWSANPENPRETGRPRQV